MTQIVSVIGAISANPISPDRQRQASANVNSADNVTSDTQIIQQANIAYLTQENNDTELAYNRTADQDDIGVLQFTNNKQQATNTDFFARNNADVIQVTLQNLLRSSSAKKLTNVDAKQVNLVLQDAVDDEVSKLFYKTSRALKFLKRSLQGLVDRKQTEGQQFKGLQAQIKGLESDLLLLHLRSQIQTANLIDGEQQAIHRRVLDTKDNNVQVDLSGAEIQEKLNFLLEKRAINVVSQNANQYVFDHEIAQLKNRLDAKDSTRVEITELEQTSAVTSKDAKQGFTSELAQKIL